MINREKRYSPAEIHFGIPWRIKIQRSGPDFAAFLCCKKTEKSENFQVFFEMKLVSALGTEEKIKKTSFKILDLKDGNDGYGWDFMNWEDVENKFLVNGSIRMECNVELKEIRRKSSRKFDDQDVSDVVLVVEDKKFYMSRLQILRLADMFDTPTATRRCEEYLMIFPTKISLKTKTRLAVQYLLEDLKQKCLNEVRTIADIPDILLIPLKELDFRLARSMLKKA
ncbi:Protein CBR-BATH-25 [Caenorhabditis briggsae]|uniref:Protein CBR-BATH-25 n=1 Tax=Caenorhabditis briggsae TaxID=6238 RepID=A8X6K9_CAEBR|nr:Protein CBR-BATH-25 [Caenorhabditis briggsae]CAP28270.2 Protein CBR-BATH-25 [Caenorhabditis briggsae]